MKAWLLVDYEPLPGIDGACRYLRYGTLASVLASRGHSVTFWTSDFDHVRKIHRNVACPIELRPNLTLRMLPGAGYRRNISLQRVLHNRTVARSFRAAVGSMQACAPPDVVVVCLHPLELAEAVASYTATADVRLVADIVDIWPDVYLRVFPEALRPLARRCLRYEYRRAQRVLSSAHSVTAVSHTYLRWGAEMRVATPAVSAGVFPLGYECTASEADAAHESEQLKEEHNLTRTGTNLAFVGQISHSYDLDTVIQAARLLYPVYRERVRFFIAGNGPERPRLEGMARSVPTIVWTGWLSHPAVTALLRSSSAGLVAYSNTATQSLPYKPFEYMAAGLPLISCLNGELADLIRREQIGLQYDAGAPESLAACVRQIADNPEHSAAMGQRAKDLFLARYRASTVYDRFANHIEEIAGAGTRSTTAIAPGITLASTCLP